MPRRSPPFLPPAAVAALTALVAAGAPGAALAYIGPGAGFALGGSFLFALAGILLAVGAIFLWPLRVALRSWRGRRRAGRARARRVIVVGLDGIDPLLCDEFMERGLLPNLKALADAGGYRRLATTLPPMSPVGWSTFATGTDAGGHNIFDFLGRDPRTHLPVLSSTRVTESGRLRKLGPWVIGRPKAKYELLRRSKPFWRTLAEHGVPSTILRVPITFPPDTYPGRMLSAMCVPDLRGTQGSFTEFSAPGAAPRPGASTGGTRLLFTRVEADHYAGSLPGPDLPTADGGHATAELPFTVRVDRAAARAHFEVGEAAFTLAADEYSPWIALEFGRGRATAHGIARFRVTSLEDPLRVYVTPINLDPERPDMPHQPPGPLRHLPGQAAGPLRDPGPGRGHLGPERAGHRRAGLPGAGLPDPRRSAAPSSCTRWTAIPTGPSPWSSTPPTASSTCSGATAIRSTRPTAGRTPRSSPTPSSRSTPPATPSWARPWPARARTTWCW